MPAVDVVIESAIERTTRVKQVEGLYDVPAEKKQRLEWKFDVPIEDEPWSVGLIVGPSGTGKSVIMKELFGGETPVKWKKGALCESFDGSVQEMGKICQAVGLNTIPTWLRPRHVLSNGEGFRADIALRLMSDADPIVVDEFTSVVDRQVGKVTAHAVQKYCRRNDRRFVAVTCHYDVEDWLQPDWVVEMPKGTFRRRSVQRRPSVEVEIAAVKREAWATFAPFHYLTANLHKAAQCFASFVDGKPVAICCILFRTHPSAKIYGVSRIVCLPDYQGLGIGPHLTDTVASAYKAVGRRVRAYPAHPSYVRVRDRSPSWALIKKPGKIQMAGTAKSTINGRLGGRPSAIFEYCGPAMEDRTAARRLVHGR